MNFEINNAVKQHALKDAPYEACGLVLVNGLGEVKVVPCENVARNKLGRFVINPNEQAEAEKFGTIAAFYHSHASEFLTPELNKFSKEDLDISYESCIPALLYVHPHDQWHFSIPQTYRPAPILGRPFAWGIWDCYTLVRDYYHIERGIKMGHYFPPADPKPSSNFGYESLVSKENFHEVPLSDLQKGDVIIFKIKSEFYNHSAIYLGGNDLIHQPINRLSCKIILDDRLQKYIVKTYRYND